jgi:peptidoglycan/LPS O-acetylase OafA/YrhL
VSILVAYILHRFIEKPVHRVGKSCARRLSQPLGGGHALGWYFGEGRA